MIPFERKHAFLCMGAVFAPLWGLCRADVLHTDSGYSDGVVVSRSASLYDAKPLCGANCCYVVLRLLGVADVRYKEVLNALPGVSERGSTLVQIGELMESRGLKCRLLSVSDCEISKFPEADVAFICLVERKGGMHFVVKRPLSAAVQIIDSPHEPTVVRKSELSSDNQCALLVSRGDFFVVDPWAKVAFSVALLLFSAFLIKKHLGGCK